MAGYTFANFFRYPIRGHVTKASAAALDYLFALFKTYLLITWMGWSKLSTGRFHFLKFSSQSVNSLHADLLLLSADFYSK